MRTLVKLLALFTIVPTVELTLLLLLADWTNWKVSLGLVLATGLLGAWLARSQGGLAFRRIARGLGERRLPTEAFADSALIVIAGILLLTPGMLSDLLAIAMLLPWTRPWFRRRLSAWAKRNFRVVHAGGSQHSEVIDSYVIDRHENAEDAQ